MADGWLFRQDELILGPVGEAQIIEKIYSHDLDGRSEVQVLGTGTFLHLAQVEQFKIHLAKAAAKKRVDHHAAQTAKASAKKRNVLLGATAAALLLIGIIVIFAGNQLAALLPGKSSDEIAYGDLISVEAPQISVAKRGGAAEELVDYPGLPGTPGVKKPTLVAKNETEKPEKPDRPRAPRPAANRLNDEKAEADGLQTAKFDQGGINEVVKRNQKSLFPCLMQASKPGLVTKVPIEFVIGNNGRVNKVWVDNPEFKEGPLPECLLKELSKWPFKTYDGENATVSLSFNIGKKS